jgi:hypothetical protein
MYRSGARRASSEAVNWVRLGPLRYLIRLFSVRAKLAFLPSTASIPRNIENREEVTIGAGKCVDAKE